MPWGRTAGARSLVVVTTTTEVMGMAPQVQETRYDPDLVAGIVEAIPAGRWMSYADVARAAGGTVQQHGR